ncbi:uncharacterized protein LOC108107806 [Drosophila eugracilis]|uniref:uncharacterized protein LOC108107806 n=1 Tax=Drosophila eugracilis TaxID=29029 RepID=UPI0007E7D5D8|nr:uncharacterized protein LOC108107806 [Drosophila eugracilis]
MILLWLIVAYILFYNPAEFSFLKVCNQGGSCVIEKWRNKTHWNIKCMEWIELEKDEVDSCPKPWKCCHTTEYEKRIPFPN